MAKKRQSVSDSGDRVDQPPLTPMIDVVFQLLIYFILTLHFKEVEGQLLSQLPKEKGLDSSPVNSPELNETRIFLCQDYSDFQNHVHNKGKHEERKKLGEICEAVVEKATIGKLYLTEKHPDRAGANRDLYRQIGAAAAKLYNSTPSYVDPSKRAPLILDADSEVPYEHVIGVVNACKEQGIENIEFVGNPRLTRYFGPKLKEVQGQ